MCCLIGESGAPVSGSMSFSDFVCFCFMFFNGVLNFILEPLKTSEKKTCCFLLTENVAKKTKKT